jgi:hypothetical protein
VISADFAPTTTAAFPPTTQPVLAFTVAAKFNKVVQVSVPLMFFKTWANSNSPGNSNTWSATLGSVSFSVAKNGVAFASGTCAASDALPKSFSVAKTTSATPATVRLYMTNASLSFTPDDSLTTDVYVVSLTPNLTNNTLAGAAGAVVKGDGVEFNGIRSGFSGGGTLSSGGPGSSFSSQSYTLDTLIRFPPTDSLIEVKVNRILANDLISDTLTTRRIETTGPIVAAERITMSNGATVENGIRYGSGSAISITWDGSRLRFLVNGAEQKSL